MFLKRYDSKRVRGWGSGNDVKGKGLSAVASGEWRDSEGIRGVHPPS
jgi:hypothetical protein